MTQLAKAGRAILPWSVALVVALAFGAPDALFQEPLAGLDAARRARDEQVAFATAPTIQVPAVASAEESFAARDEAAAIAAVQTAVRRAGADTGVLIERLDPAAAPQPDSPLRLDLLASGNEKALLRFAAALQAMRPLLAIPTWEVSAGRDAAGALRLDARILAAWHEAD